MSKRRNQMRKFKVLSVALVLCGSAHAEFWSGNDLLTRIQSNEYADRSLALGYVMGVFDSSRGTLHCNNIEGVTAGQVRDIAKNYLINNPQYRHMSADLIVGVSLGQVWPCAQKKSGGQAL
jgi:hypothetical protein